MEIHIASTKLRAGLILGYKLSRLEWVWRAGTIETKMALPALLEEVENLLPSNIKISHVSYHCFSQGILNHYFATDIEMNSAILIGICIERSQVIGTLHDEEFDTQMLYLARSCLLTIPDNIIPDKDRIFEFILENKNDTIYSIIEKIFREQECESLKNSTRQNVGNGMVFISYSSAEFDFAKEIFMVLKSNGINCWIAPQSIPSGSDYGKCIPLAIEKCAVFLLLLSTESQKSKWVPKELDLAITYDKIIIPFHIDNSALEKAFSFRLSNIQRIEAYNRSAKACDELVDILQKIV